METFEATRTQDIDISFVVPCHNEVANVSPLADRVAECFCTDDIRCEMVLIDDGSTDGTLDALRALVERSREIDDLSVFPRITVASFSRNFGKESALYAGMELASGTLLCFIDADLQQDPATAREMYDYLEAHDDCDIVAAYQENRKEGKVISWLKERFYGVFNATSDEIELPTNMSDFRMFRRSVADALLSMPEYFRFTKGLFAWVGFSSHTIPYTVHERKSGTSNWNARSLFKYAFEGITAFSTWPLKALKYIGGLFAVLSGLYLLYVLIVDYLILGNTIPGYATLVCLILMFGGLQLAAIGVVGDYLARSYVEGKRRPLYIVRESFSSKE